MNGFLSSLIIAVLLFVMSGWPADAAGQLEKAPPKKNGSALEAPPGAKRRYGNKLLDSKKLSGPALISLLGQSAVYELQIENEMARIAGPPSITHVLIERNGEFRFVENDADACETITKCEARPTRPLDIQLLVGSFVKLRGYKVQLHTPFRGGRTEVHRGMNFWKYELSRSPEEWAVKCVLLTDRFRSACCEYEFRVTEKGEFTALRGEMIYSEGGYR